MDVCLAPDTNNDSGIGCDNMTVVIVALLNERSEDEWYSWVSEKYAHLLNQESPIKFRRLSSDTMPDDSRSLLATFMNSQQQNIFQTQNLHQTLNSMLQKVHAHSTAYTQGAIADNDSSEMSPNDEYDREITEIPSLGSDERDDEMQSSSSGDFSASTTSSVDSNSSPNSGFQFMSASAAPAKKQTSPGNPKTAKATTVFSHKIDNEDCSDDTDALVDYEDENSASMRNPSLSSSSSIPVNARSNSAESNDSDNARSKKNLSPQLQKQTASPHKISQDHENSADAQNTGNTNERVGSLAKPSNNQADASEDDCGIETDSSGITSHAENDSGAALRSTKEVEPVEIETEITVNGSSA